MKIVWKFTPSTPACVENKYINVKIIAVLVKRRAQTLQRRIYQQFLENSLNFYMSTDLFIWLSQTEIQNMKKNRKWSFTFQ